MKRKPYTTGSESGAIVPLELHHVDAYRSVADLGLCEYGWVQIWVDQNNAAFVYASEPVRDQQGENSPHMIIRKDAGYSARLFTQRVRRLNSDLSKSKAVIPIVEVEF